MDQVIELCAGCGFEISTELSACPSCEPHPDDASLAGRLRSGDALPSRSAHALGTIAARRELTDQPVGSPWGGLPILGYATLLLLVTLLGLVLGWLVRLDRFVLALPRDLGGRIDGLTAVAGTASAIALAVALAIIAAQAIRWTVLVAIRHWAGHDTFA